MDVQDLKEELRRKISAQRETLEADERFLVELEQRTAGSPPRPRQATRPNPRAAPAHLSGSEAISEEGLRQVKAGEKGEIIVAILRESGRQSPKAIKSALRERGIDPDAGTEVKRVLWQLAKDEKIVRHPDAREYEFPQAQLNGHRTTEDSPL